MSLEGNLLVRSKENVWIFLWLPNKKFNESKGDCCCRAGEVKLSQLQKLPEPLRSLILGSHPKNVHFLDRLRIYNWLFQMTSFGCDKIYERGQLLRQSMVKSFFSILSCSGCSKTVLSCSMKVFCVFIGIRARLLIAFCYMKSGIKMKLVNQIIWKYIILFLFHNNKSKCEDRLRWVFGQSVFY